MKSEVLIELLAKKKKKTCRGSLTLIVGTGTMESDYMGLNISTTGQDMGKIL